MVERRFAVQNVATEWSYTSGKQYADPFDEVELDVLVTAPDGCEQRVPAYWAGAGEWRVRYAAHTPGIYSCRTVCSDAQNPDLHGRELTLEVQPYEGQNPLLAHGPLRVSEDGRYLEHRDGTPFFWLGDTWWMCLCKRMDWPSGFQTLTADRVAKGFSVIQIVAGLYPDMVAFGPRGENEPSARAGRMKPAGRGSPTGAASTPPISTWPTCASPGSCAAACCPASSAAGVTICP